MVNLNQNDGENDRKRISTMSVVHPVKSFSSMYLVTDKVGALYETSPRYSYTYRDLDDNTT